MEKRVEQYAKGSDESHLWNGLLLLRGLLTSNILLFALAERRWCVDYGLLPESQLEQRENHSMAATILAVPYCAKDVPALNTQFGHPDLTIILTCLSYYYSGLRNEQLRTSFEILFDQDEPSEEYTHWMKEYELVPDSLHKLSEINLASLEQWGKVIFPFFAWNQATIDFYLSQVVFPKEAKEFPWKFSGSSWDLAEKREKLITGEPMLRLHLYRSVWILNHTSGFLGTNDGRWLLPMSIAQCDIDHQKGSNTRVLAYLLRPKNGSYMVAHESNARWITHAFLQLVTMQQPEIRVLLDVSSQILDLSGRQVAEAWLEIARDTPDTIYFSDTDELMVITRNGTSLPMSASPLSQQLDQCVVYLDHAHTRGTDIKLPVGSQAAVTLGPMVTKDALVQGLFPHCNSITESDGL